LRQVLTHFRVDVGWGGEHGPFAHRDKRHRGEAAAGAPENILDDGVGVDDHGMTTRRWCAVEHVRRRDRRTWISADSRRVLHDRQE
jgi:hypothetical protein